MSLCRAASLFGLLVSLCAGQEEPPHHWPSGPSLLVEASEPHVAHWVVADSLQQLGLDDAPCGAVFVMIDWVVDKYHDEFAKHRMLLHEWQDRVAGEAYSGPTATARNFFSSPGFAALLRPVSAVHRLSANVASFLASLALLHARRCFYPTLRDTLGAAIAQMPDFSVAMHKLEFALVYKGVYSFWDKSTDMWRHLSPVWDAMELAARFADTLGDVRVVLDRLQDPKPGDEAPVARSPDWESADGAFSKMQVLYRKLFGGWHLDHGLAASLMRIWPPPAGALNDGHCHTTIADFGAGSGHYCQLFNKTGDYCCHAFDGSKYVARYSEGKVQAQRIDVPFSLNRTFDWIVCLEVAEHVPPASEHTLLGNLRRHARQGLVLSWSEHSGPGHPSARPWPEVRAAVEANGFVLEEALTAQLRPRVSWLQGNVHIFLTV